ncbi:hypothetical protein P7K49_003883 [Saguinus oedipus]|uniref:Uncharacterized protein n=1 Tax=Saguinus oedipus TaxID=9490 RepID=A0ABQ9W5S9_SAGOE|nr:hypothetical protein P7K49_003883 [Saguinus oedipus]
MKCGDAKPTGTPKALELGEKAGWKDSGPLRRGGRGQGPGRRTRTDTIPSPPQCKSRRAGGKVAVPEPQRRLHGQRAKVPRNPSPGARQNQRQRTQELAAVRPRASGSERQDRNRLTNRKWVV